MQDIVVYISLDTASAPRPTLLPLILSFEGEFAYKEYNQLEDVAKDFTGAKSPTKLAAEALFNQVKVKNCPGRIQKVAVFGVAADTAAASVTAALDTLRETHDDWYFLIDPEYTDNAVLELLYELINKRTSRRVKLPPGVFDMVTKIHGVYE